MLASTAALPPTPLAPPSPTCCCWCKVKPGGDLLGTGSRAGAAHVAITCLLSCTLPSCSLENSQFCVFKGHISFFFFSFLAALWHMEFPGQGSDLSRSCNYATAAATQDPHPIEPGQGSNQLQRCCQSHCATVGTLGDMFLLLFFFLIFIFWLYLWHVDIPRPGIEPTPQQQPKPQHSQHWVLNPLSHRETPKGQVS